MTVNLLNDTEATTDLHTETIDLSEFLTTESAGMGHYLRVFVDKQNREIRVYKPIGDDNPTEPREYVRTVISDVRARFINPPDGYDTPSRFNLHGGEARTFETFLDSLKGSRKSADVRFTWYGENNSQNMKESSMNLETIILKWDNGSRSQEVTINRPYKHVGTGFAGWD